MPSEGKVIRLSELKSEPEPKDQEINSRLEKVCGQYLRSFVKNNNKVVP